eukprot:763179-Hanusia_phi.AAC.3
MAVENCSWASKTEAISLCLVLWPPDFLPPSSLPLLHRRPSFISAPPSLYFVSVRFSRTFANVLKRATISARSREAMMSCRVTQSTLLLNLLVSCPPPPSRPPPPPPYQAPTCSGRRRIFSAPTLLARDAADAVRREQSLTFVSPVHHAGDVVEDAFPLTLESRLIEFDGMRLKKESEKEEEEEEDKLHEGDGRRGSSSSR